MEWERRKSIRNHWKRELTDKAIKNKLNWSYLEKFKGTQEEIPENLTANDLAEHFDNLTNDYTPIPNEGFKEEEIGRICKFKFKLPITVGDEDELTDLKLLLKTCPNSPHSASWDNVNIALLRKMPDRILKVIAYIMQRFLYCWSN